MIRLVIFDWDDVFTLGSTEGYYKCYHVALEGVSISLPSEEEDRRIKAKWGSGHAAQLQDLLREHPELVARAIKIYEDCFFGDTFVDCLSIVPGSTEMLTELAKDYTLAVATGGHPDILKERVIPKFNIPDVFSQILTIYDIDDISHAKPHPFMLEKIMEKQGILPEETAFVGDAKNDVLMARNAHVTPVVVLTGHLSKSQAEELNVTHIIENVTQLKTVLQALNRQ